MTAQRGKDILLKIEGAPGAFTTVAGLRARRRRTRGGSGSDCLMRGRRCG